MGANFNNSRKVLLRKALILSILTIVYNLLEGLVSVYFGVAEESISLAGFGVDSFIEVGSAFFVLQRLYGEDRGTKSLITFERQATQGIGLLFILLAVSTFIASVYQLSEQAHPVTTAPGMVISVASLSFMFWLWRSKRALAQKLDSLTLWSDAGCSLACIQLSGVLFLGSLLYFLAPSLWWVDSVAAIGIAIMIGREGVMTITAARSVNFTGGCGCGKCD